MDKLDFLNAGEPAPEDAPELPVVEPVVTEPALAPEPVPEAVAPQQPAPDARSAVPEGYVPLAAMLDTRDKVKAAEQRAAQAEEQLRKLQERPAPDPYADPEGYQTHQSQQTQHAILTARLDFSEEMAREKHGEAVVDAAKEWALQRFAENPAFQAEVLAQRNPYGYTVMQYQRQQALGKLGDPSEVDAFLAWKAAQGAVPPAQPLASVPALEQPAIPTRSIASATNAGGGAAHEPSGPGQAFAQTFGN